MQEFPKILYMDGALDAETVIVHDEDQEAEARVNGFAALGESEADIEALRAEAESLGVKVDKRWKAGRLADEIAKAKG